MSVPALRFPEFERDWEERRLDQLSNEKLSNGVFNDPSKVGSGYKLVNVKDMYLEGFIDPDALSLVAISESEFSKNKVSYGDIFFTRSSLVKEGIAFSNVFLSDSEDTTFDGHLIRIRPALVNWNPVFLYFCLKTDAQRRQLVARGKTGTMTTIGQSDIASVKASLPSLPEQKKIAAFLEVVDDKLSALQVKRDLLAEYKRGLMQALFSQQIRFTDANGQAFPDWEEKRLGDVAEIYQPKTISQTEMSDEGYLVFGANGIIGRYSKFNHELPQVTVTCRGNTCGQVTLTSAKVWITGNTMVINLDSSESANKLFMYFLLSNTNWTYLITGSGQPQITGEIKKHKFLLPHPDEQQKIADSLAAMDAKINAVAAQVDGLQNFKKGLLQQMFV